MQEHQQQPEQQTHSPASIPGLIPNRPDSIGTLAASVDTYLDAVCAALPPEVEAEAVRDMRREMRSHLEAAIVADMELGHSSEQAIEQALAQFGKPQLVARQWQQEWEQTLTDTKVVSFWPSLKVALKMWTLSNVLTVAASAILAMMLLTNENSPLRVPLMLTIFFAPPLVSGTIIGLRARRHPVLATFAGYVLLLPLLITGLAAINAAQGPYITWITGKTYAQYAQPFGYYVGAGFRGAMSFAALWIILSVFSSGMVTLARRFKTRRRQIAH